MTVTGVNSSATSVLADLQTRAKLASSTATSTTGTDTISLSTDTIDFALSGDAQNVQDSNPLSLFSVLNANVLDYPNLAGVGSAINTYTSSLASSNVYDSSYTAPSAKFLADLADLKSAAASGNQAKSESLLATAKLDAPDTVGGGISTAIAKGDTTGETGLISEGTSNISDFLAANGYSSEGAAKEAAAITINGLSLDATDTSTSTAQTHLQQISNLATYAAQNQGSFSTSSDLLFNIVSTLLEADNTGPNGARSTNPQVGLAIDQSLTDLVNQYGVGTSGSTSTIA